MKTVLWFGGLLGLACSFYWVAFRVFFPALTVIGDPVWIALTGMISAIVCLANLFGGLGRARSRSAIELVCVSGLTAIIALGYWGSMALWDGVARWSEPAVAAINGSIVLGLTALLLVSAAVSLAQRRFNFGM